MLHTAKIIRNKRGDDLDAKKFPFGLILILIILAVLIFYILSSGVLKKYFATIGLVDKDCLGAEVNGICTSRCDAPGDRIYDATCGKDSNLICCKSNVGITNACDGKAKGEYCDANKLMVCLNSGKDCESKCVFCSQNPAHKLCNSVTNDKNKKVVFNSGFGCDCTSSQCTGLKDNGKCVTNFCPTTTPADTFCCDK